MKRLLSWRTKINDIIIINGAGDIESGIDSG